MSFRLKIILILGIVSAISLGGYLVASQTVYRLGFPLDDAWIHQTYARNLAERGEWAFLPSQPSAGSTAPGWSLLLAAGHLLGLGPYVWTFLLGWLLLWGLAVIGASGLHAFSVTQIRRGLWAGLLLALEWHLVWAAGSGMETLLLACIIIVVLIWVTQLEFDKGSVEHNNVTPTEGWRWLGVGVVVGLTVWFRPDGVTLLGAVGWVVFFGSWKVREKLRIGIVVFLGFMLLFLPYLVFNHSLAGEWLPNTFYAKQAEYAFQREAPYWERFLAEARLPLIGVGAILLPGFLWTCVQIVRKQAWSRLASALWFLGYLAVYAWRLPVVYQHGRYIIPAMPVFFLLGIAGLFGWSQVNPDKGWRRLIRRAWMIATSIVILVFWAIGAKAFAQDTAVIESEMVNTAHWIDSHTESDALVAAHDIGALGYFGGRALLDLAGLVIPDVIPFIRDEQDLSTYLDQQGADYLMTFPGWYPRMVVQRRRVYQSNGRFSPLLGGENMFVYRWRSP